MAVSAGYVVVAIAFAFVPGAGIEWRPAPASLVLSGSIVTAVLLGVAHMFRRSFPVVVSAIGLVVLLGEALVTGTTSVGVILIECDVLYSLVVARSTPRSRGLLPAIAAACLSLSVAGLLLANVLPAPFLQATILLLAVGVTLWWGVSVRTPMSEAAHERERAALLAEAAEAKHREILTAERFQISRELHDAVSGHLSAITMQSAAATAAPGQLDVTELASGMTRIRTLSLEAMGSMRTLIEVLRSGEPGPITMPCTWSSVRELIGQAIASGASVTMTGDDPRSADLDLPTAVAAYNVVNEALVNAAKHAPGMEVNVEITNGGGDLEIAVANRRETPSPADSVRSGYGLVGLAERVRLCGGRLDIDQSDGSWTLRARLPQAIKRELRHA